MEKNGGGGRTSHIMEKANVVVLAMGVAMVAVVVAVPSRSSWAPCPSSSSGVGLGNCGLGTSHINSPLLVFSRKLGSTQFISQAPRKSSWPNRVGLASLGLHNH